MVPPIAPAVPAGAVAERAEEHRSPLRLVRRATRLGAGAIGTLAVAMVFGTLFALAALQAVLVQGQIHLDELDRQIDNLGAARSALEVDVATAEAPERIQATAAAYGLVSPPDVVFLDRTSVVSVEPTANGLSLHLDTAGDATPAAQDGTG